MKKFFTKMITVYVIVASLVLVLKVGDNMLAKASTSNIGDQCGINNGWVWNGTQCVDVCDQSHPWDSGQQKCSNGYGYYGNYYGSNGYGYIPGNSNYMGNCAAYGSNYFWNGSVCVEITSRPNATYGGNPYSGGYTTPVYNYNNYNGYNDYNSVSYAPSVQTNTCNSCSVQNTTPRVITTYYIYTTTTTSVPSYSNYSGYLNNNSNYAYLGNNNYNYSNNYSDYSNYSNNNSDYAYLGNNYNGNGNDYWDSNYSDYSNVGYYDIYGNYHS